jgi:hypothetical protein
MRVRARRCGRGPSLPIRRKRRGSASRTGTSRAQRRKPRPQRPRHGGLQRRRKHPLHRERLQTTGTRSVDADDHDRFCSSRPSDRGCSYDPLDGVGAVSPQPPPLGNQRRSPLPGPPLDPPPAHRRVDAQAQRLLPDWCEVLGERSLRERPPTPSGHHTIAARTRAEAGHRATRLLLDAVGCLTGCCVWRPQPRHVGATSARGEAGAGTPGPTSCP